MRKLIVFASVVALAAPAAANFEALISRVTETMPHATDSLSTLAIAALEGDSSGSVTKLLTRMLVNESDFKVSDRSKIDAILKEQALGLSGVVDPTSAAKVGEIAGVDAVLYGSVEERTSGTTVRRELTLSLVSTTDGTVIWTDSDDESETTAAADTTATTEKGAMPILYVLIAAGVVVVVLVIVLVAGKGKGAGAPSA